MFDNFFLLFMSAGVIFLWLTVNQVRQDIKNRRNTDREAQDETFELTAIENDSSLNMWKWIFLKNDIETRNLILIIEYFRL